uniref:hypothetical protein n=1 Tax=uncultured Halomonas sp. TaxID=173971 RepID=UPI002601BF0B
MSRQVSVCADCGTENDIHHHNCATHERAPVLDKEEMLKLMALELEAWPQDCDDCERTEPTGWGWCWHDVPPDCEFVLAVPGRDGCEWAITEKEWRASRWDAGEDRIDRIAQSDASGDHYAEDSDAGSAQSLKEHRPGIDKMRLEGDTVVRDFFEQEMVKQARYQDAKGGDWIDEFAR